MADKNPRRSAGQLRRQLRTQRNRVVVPTIIAILCTTFVVIAYERLSRSQVGVLVAFAVFAIGSAATDAMLWREKRTRIAELEQDAAQQGAATDKSAQ